MNGPKFRREELFDTLVHHFCDTTDSDRLLHIQRLLRSLAWDRVPGDVVELGCYKGATSVWIQHILGEEGSGRVFHVFDSFEGLPEPGFHDTYLHGGEVAASVEEFNATFDLFGLPLPEIHRGWFQETLPGELPDVIAFAYIDADFYDSILVSLEAVYPRMARDGLMLVDDYADTCTNPRAWDGLPGVKKAVDEFMVGKPETVKVLFGEGDLAFGLIQRG